MLCRTEGNCQQLISMLIKRSELVSDCCHGCLQISPTIWERNQSVSKLYWSWIYSLIIYIYLYTWIQDNIAGRVRDIVNLLSCGTPFQIQFSLISCVSKFGHSIISLLLMICQNLTVDITFTLFLLFIGNILNFMIIFHHTLYFLMLVDLWQLGRRRDETGTNEV